MKIMRFRIVGASLLLGMSLTAVAASLISGSSAWPKTDFSQTRVNLTEIISGGPPRDGIPAIDHPRFVDSSEVVDWLKSDEPVIALHIGKQARAYPLQIMLYHEIVNDVVAGVPVAVTFCPLCHAALVFERRLHGQVLDFGTTGRLRNSDLVMYDRQTESWWQQFSGEAIVGSMVGQKLVDLPATIVSLAEFARTYPAGKVLSRNTGYRRPYGRNPYAGYDSITDRPWLFSGAVDQRLKPMERVLSVTIGNKMKLYPMSKLRSESIVQERVNGRDILVIAAGAMYSALDRSTITASRKIPSMIAFESRVDGRKLLFHWQQNRLVDEQTGSTWSALGAAVSGPLKGQQLPLLRGGMHFAFAWLAFNPEVPIYGFSK